MPDFVKKADFSEQVEVDSLPREAFADPLERKFPIHSKAAAYLSYAYFHKQAGSLDLRMRERCEQGFNKAAQYWGLKDEYTKITSPVTEKQAAGPAKLGPTDVLKAASELVQRRGEFTYETRLDAAKKIMKAASETGLPLSMIPQEVHRMAGHGMTTKEAAVIELTRRWDSEIRPSLAEPLHTCLTAINSLQSGLIGGEVCEKIASIIDRYDRSKGSNSFPEDVLFAFTKHSADQFTKSLATLPDGTSYWINDLTEKAAEAFNVLGNDLVKALKDVDGRLNQIKVADLISTLPRIDTELLKDALTTMGVQPVSMDKHAMVSLVVKTVQTPGFTVMPAKTEKRSDVLKQLEANDPLVKRALDVVRRLKVSECSDKKNDDKKPANPGAAETPRGLKGLFINKAPNEAKIKPAAK